MNNTEPTEPQLIELPPVQANGQHFEQHKRNVLDSGFAPFNGYPHLCVEIPDGGFTITARTSTGEQITFAFVPYKTGGAPSCVDIQRHTSKRSMKNGATPLPLQDWILFKPGTNTFRTDAQHPCTLATILLHEPK